MIPENAFTKKGRSVKTMKEVQKRQKNEDVEKAAERISF